MTKPWVSRFLPVLAFCTLVTGALATHTVAQGSKEDYQRANRWGRLTRGVGASASLRLNWLPDDSGAVFLGDYGGDQPGWILADAVSGETQPVLNDSALISALRAQGVKPGRIHSVLPSDDSLWIWAGSPSRAFRWSQSRLIQPKASAATPFDLRSVPAFEARRSQNRGSFKCKMLVLNQTEEAWSMHWVDSRGRTRGYGEIKAGKSIELDTYSGHVWKAEAADKKRAIYTRATQFGGRWLIRESEIIVPKPRRRPAQRGAAQIVVKEHNVWLRPAAKGKSRGRRSLKPLSNNGKADEGFVGPVYTSPDRRYAVVRWRCRGARRKISVLQSSPKESIHSETVSFGYAKPGDARDSYQLWLFDVRKAKGVAVDTVLYSNHYALSQFDWLADSSTFFFLHNERGHQRIRVIGVDAKTAEARVLVEDSSETFIHYSGKLQIRHLRETAELLMTSERDGWNHLYLHDAKTGALKRQLTQGEWVVRKIDRVDRDQRMLYFWAGGLVQEQDPYFQHWCRVHLDTGELTVLTEGDGHHEVERSPGGGLFIDRWSRVDLPPRATLRRISDGSAVCHLDQGSSASELRLNGSQNAWPIPERFRAKGRDGTTDIYGVIFKPSNFDPRNQYPVVEQIYAGPHGAHVPKSFRASHGAQATAELGFIVVQIDGMGTSERSKAFHDVCWRNLADAGFPDRKLWITKAAESRPYMDLSRVGIYGGSAGGQNAARALLDHHDFYHVAVADCGCHDNRVDKIWWNEQWMGYPIGPWYAESSNTHHAARLQGKLLLILGELDRNVDPASTYQFIDALIRADKDFDFVLIPNAGHGAAGTPYGKRRKWDHLVRHLLHVTPRH